VPLPVSRASSFTAFGPEDFVRSTGAPVQETRTFTVSNPGLPYMLRLYNGGQQGQYCPISSATVLVNGRTIFSQSNFNPNVTLLEAPVVLAASNTVVVELFSKPGCGITLLIAGDNAAPVADAGPDHSGRVNTTVTLDGSASSDADGDDLTYQWSVVSKPLGRGKRLESRWEMGQNRG
jgi:PKD domain